MKSSYDPDNTYFGTLSKDMSVYVLKMLAQMDDASWRDVISAFLVNRKMYFSLFKVSPDIQNILMKIKLKNYKGEVSDTTFMLSDLDRVLMANVYVDLKQSENLQQFIKVHPVASKVKHKNSPDGLTATHEIHDTLHFPVFCADVATFLLVALMITFIINFIYNYETEYSMGLKPCINWWSEDIDARHDSSSRVFFGFIFSALAAVPPILINNFFTGNRRAITNEISDKLIEEENLKKNKLLNGAIDINVRVESLPTLFNNNKSLKEGKAVRSTECNIL